MLQVIRQLAKSWVFKALMVLLIISFGIWGIGDMFRGNPLQRTVAKVGDIAITVQALEREFEAALPEARQVFGPDLTAPKAREIGVLDRTLKVMMEHAAFDQEIKRLGINVSDKPVLDKIAAEPSLRDKNGNFQADLWRQALAKGGFSERSFLDNERRNAERRVLLLTLANDVKTPKVILDNLYRARGARRILEVLAVHNDSMKDIAQPDEKTLQEFHQQHGGAFSAPEYRAITVAKLSTDDVTKDISISEDDIRKAYDAHPEDVTLPEQRDFVQVILQDEAKAKAFADAAKASGDLRAAAKTQSLNPVDLDRVDEKSVLPELYTTLFAMQEKQVSEPTKTGFGWHVVQLKKIYAGGKQTFDEAKDKLREAMQREQSGDIVARMVNQLDDSLAAGHPLEDTADILKLRLVKIPAVDSTGKTPEDKEPEELPAREEVLKQAFGQAAGETSQVLDDKKGNYFVVRTDDITPAHVVPYEEVKEAVLKAWNEEQQAKQAVAKAEDIARELRDGAKIVSYASQPGIEVRFSKPISILGESDDDLPANAYPKILVMKKGDVVTAQGTDRQFVLRLADIASVDPAKPDSGMEKIAADLHDRVPYELVEEYSKFLRQRFPFKIDEQLLDSLKKKGS
ncbi:MAG: SurA N-terminal domain-containing protein [Alphaproteobacteria bacterium]|nr:SurA N-terminal domain-containing protein [Alphaproteobacteria bacterium]